MSKISRRLDELWPEHDWRGCAFETFVTEMSEQGIEIGTDTCRGRLGNSIEEPAISFSGFCSQGDGIAFDCTVKWAEFIPKHPDMMEAIPHWYMLLAANPDYIVAGSSRYSRGNTMRIDADWDGSSDERVECGFFAGEKVDYARFDLVELENYLEGVLEGAADTLYNDLELTYEGEIEYRREQEVEHITEENADRLRQGLLAIAMLGDLFTTQAVDDTLGGVYDDFDADDLEALGLIEHVHGVNWRLTDKGRSLSNDTQGERR